MKLVIDPDFLEVGNDKGLKDDQVPVYKNS